MSRELTAFSRTAQGQGRTSAPPSRQQCLRFLGCLGIHFCASIPGMSTGPGAFARCSGSSVGLVARQLRGFWRHLNSAYTEMTVIGYCHSGETVPYRTKLVDRDITPHRFRSLISKKGNHRYFHRSCQEFGTDVVSEEMPDDNEVLSLGGKILAMVEPVD
ncbi:hypothetical protein HPB52_022529 [Rhipicephalus sanguineus]|uniref:DIX domain-containing protein n=1 Tax=Rhipicephalus sanguineus TaxID=34632 RepID=A0A9D4PXV8_RHISA|nr:hypothetical protein HPB52_022529 [Rhipicephalus sanguineus]